MSEIVSFTNLLPSLVKGFDDTNGEGVLKALYPTKTPHLALGLKDGVFTDFIIYHFDRTPLPNGEVYTVAVFDVIFTTRSNAFVKNGEIDGLERLFWWVLRKIVAVGSDRVEVVLKRAPGETLEIEHFLDGLGFSQKKVIEGFYRNRCLKYGYRCRQCGESVDICEAVFYTIEGRTAKLLTRVTDFNSF